MTSCDLPNPRLSRGPPGSSIDLPGSPAYWMGIRHQAMGTDPLYNTVRTPRQAKMSVDRKATLWERVFKKIYPQRVSRNRTSPGKFQWILIFFRERNLAGVRAASFPSPVRRDFRSGCVRESPCFAEAVVTTGVRKNRSRQISTMKAPFALSSSTAAWVPSAVTPRQRPKTTVTANPSSSAWRVVERTQ
jgi:hypothetical protein